MELTLGKFILLFCWILDALIIVGAVVTLATETGNVNGNLWLIPNAIHIFLALYALSLTFTPLITIKSAFFLIGLSVLAMVADACSFGARINMIRQCNEGDLEIECEEYLWANGILLALEILWLLLDVAYIVTGTFLYREAAALDPHEKHDEELLDEAKRARSRERSFQEQPAPAPPSPFDNNPDAKRDAGHRALLHAGALQHRALPAPEPVRSPLSAPALPSSGRPTPQGKEIVVSTPHAAAAAAVSRREERHAAPSATSNPFVHSSSSSSSYASRHASPYHPPKSSSPGYHTHTRSGFDVAVANKW